VWDVSKTGAKLRGRYLLLSGSQHISTTESAANLLKDSEQPDLRLLEMTSATNGEGPQNPAKKTVQAAWTIGKNGLARE
jgi:hypothetical protein